MARHESNAFVLQSYPLREADKVCVFFTHDYGKVRGVAHGAKKLRSRYGASLEPLSEVYLEYYEREGRELVTIQRCELLRSVFDKESDPQGQAAVHYLVELADRFLPPHAPNEKVYRLISAIVSCLSVPVPRWPLLVFYFEVWMLKLSGFFARPDCCVSCGRVVPSHEAIRLSMEGRPECMACRPGSGGIILAPFVRQAIDALLSQPPERWLNQVRDPEALRPFARFLRGFIRRVLETEVEAERFVDI